MSVPSSHYDPAPGNSGPGGPLGPTPTPVPAGAWPLILGLNEITYRVVTLRYKTLIERRVEIAPKGGGEPLLTLSANDARALGYILRRLATEADRQP
jgi:hypothetical protein